eukprot:3927032-Rhodomonas_salina.1
MHLRQTAAALQRSCCREKAPRGSSTEHLVQGHCTRPGPGAVSGAAEACSSHLASDACVSQWRSE